MTTNPTNERTIMLQYLRSKKILSIIGGVLFGIWFLVSPLPFFILSLQEKGEYYMLLWLPLIIFLAIDLVLALILRSRKRRALMQIKALQNNEPLAPHPGLANQQYYQYAHGQPQGQQYPYPNPAPAAANEQQPQGQPLPAGWVPNVHPNSAPPHEAAQVTSSPH